MKQKIKKFIQAITARAFKVLFLNQWVPFRGIILFLINKRLVQVQSLSLVDSTRVTTLLNGCSYEIYAPSFSCVNVKKDTGYFPSVKAVELSNATISVYSPAVLTNGVLYLPAALYDNKSRQLTSSAQLFRPSNRMALVKRRHKLSLKTGIHIGGAGAFNWYHFLLECLPKAYLASNLPVEYQNIPLIVPREVQSIPSFKEAFDAVAQQRPWVSFSRKDTVTIERLVIIDDVNVGPFNMAEGAWPTVSDYALHVDFMREYITVIRSAILGPYVAKAFNRKIFMARPEIRRSYNQAELIAIAKKYDFEVVYPELLSLSEQARMFSEASIIIGASGAAWVGIIFCKNPVLGLSWLPKEYKEFSVYSTIAKTLGHQLNFIEAIPSERITSTGEAYIANYNICPVKFEDSLCLLLET